jgi:hypothetical protein
VIVTDTRVVEFVESFIGKCRYPCTAVGQELNGRIVAGAIYERNNGHNIIFHGASDGSKRWASKGFVRALVVHPFVELDLPRMSTPVAASNHLAMAFDLALGFEEECRQVGAAHDGSDLVWLVMWRDRCRWL